MNCWNVVLNYYKKHGLRYAAGLILVVATTALNSSIPRLLGDIIDALQASGPTPRGIWMQCLVMGLVALSAFLIQFLWRYLIMGFGRGVEMELRRSIFFRLQDLSSDFYVRNNTGDLITRAISDVLSIRQMCGMGIVGIVDVFVTNLVSITYMVGTAGWKLTAMAVVPLPFLVWLLVIVRTEVRKRFTAVQRSMSDISSKVQENVTGIRVVKTFAQEDSESQIFSGLSRKKWKAEMDMAKVSSIISPTVNLAFGIVFSVFLVLGAAMVAKESLTVGQFTAFNGYLLLIIDPINRISRVITIWQRGRVSATRIDRILTAKPSVDDAQADSSVTDIGEAKVEVQNLSFTYPGTETPVLRDISFALPSGGILAVMGPTGCGKSTLANLLMRMWACPQGGIRIGGHEIASIPLQVLRQACAYVPQDNFLFSDTVMNNIRFYDDRISEEEAVLAAKQAAVDDNITELAEGYGTRVGERGMTLSGGQKQRISIARALAKKPKFLLLDDCLSAVDAETEQIILKNLRDYMKGCTALMITNRVSAAMLADNILLLDETGRQVALGSHEALKASSPEYRRLLDVLEKEDRPPEGTEGDDANPREE